MIKFVPELKPHLMVVYLKILESWMVVFGLNQVWSSFGYDLNFKFSRAHSSASFFLSLMRTRCSSAAMRAVRCCTASTAAAYYSCCRRMCARVSTQVLSTAQDCSHHLSASMPRCRNWPPHTKPLPCTCPHQAIECVASPSRSCFTRYHAAPFFPPRASARSSFLCHHCC
jgi:hypothetical protein